MKNHRITAALAALGLMLTALPVSAVSAAGHRASVHDPSVIKDGNTYYVFGSHIEAAKSTDLINWDRFTNGYATPNNVEFGDLSSNLKKTFAWAGENLEGCAGDCANAAHTLVYNWDYRKPFIGCPVSLCPFVVLQSGSRILYCIAFSAEDKNNPILHTSLHSQTTCNRL